MEDQKSMPQSVLQERLNKENYEKLQQLNNKKLHEFIAECIELCNPSSVYVCDDSQTDYDYIRNKAIEAGEEHSLATKGHTYHCDGYNDQARDKANTKYLLPPEVKLGHNINSTDRVQGIQEIKGNFKDSMVGKEVIIRFFCLGPVGSEFSIPCVQITDSYYVSHSEGILYRAGFKQFKNIGDSPAFFRFLHTAGELDERGNSVNIDKRRVYIDLQDEIVYSTNTQYAGNTVGLKKLAMRLAIQKASREGWLTEHMFIMGVRGIKNKDRITYFTGAFPSACGKTSTAMLEGEKIVGDDIAYIRNKDGVIKTVNVEAGIFGIIKDVNAKGDPSIYEALRDEGEVIFSNVLISEDLKPFWLGCGDEIPSKGNNHSGAWITDKKDAKGNEITCSHKNARYTISLSKLKNKDDRLDDPEGVEVAGFIYGGRDSDTSVPVEQAFDWEAGICIKGATIESETTAATLGQEGVRVWNPMSNLDFLSVPYGRYIQNNLDIIKGTKKTSFIFSVNYFLRDENGKFLNDIKDKHIWIKWMDMRVNGEVSALETPTGMIPKYEDLKMLFREVAGKDFTEEDYKKQFTIRIPKILAKLNRNEEIYRSKVADTPQELFTQIDKYKKRLEEARKQYGDYISPFDLSEIK
ncbi:phosphoenolpyruvate carboxykinase (GTP) [Candidatus Omnitrophota bacterium]